jgi:hypothetical protein
MSSTGFNMLNEIFFKLKIDIEPLDGKMGSGFIVATSLQSVLIVFRGKKKLFKTRFIALKLNKIKV